MQHKANLKLQFVSRTAQSAWAVKNIMEVSEGPDRSQRTAEGEQRMMEEVEKNLPIFLNSMWTFVVQDIEKTSAHVFKKLVKDVDCAWQVRARRAFALLRIGQIFQEIGAQGEDGDAKRRLEEALSGAVKR